MRTLTSYFGVFYLRVDYYGKTRKLAEQIRLILVHLKYTLQDETYWTGWKYWAEKATFLPIFASEWTYLRYWMAVHHSLNLLDTLDILDIMERLERKLLCLRKKTGQARLGP